MSLETGSVSAQESSSSEEVVMSFERMSELLHLTKQLEKALLKRTCKRF